MTDRNENRGGLNKVGPLIFLLTLVVVIEFFWWFMSS